jgi:hypothetical protein
MKYYSYNHAEDLDLVKYPYMSCYKQSTLSPILLLALSTTIRTLRPTWLVPITLHYH